MLPVRETFYGVAVDVFLAHTNFLEGKDCLEWEGPKSKRFGPYLEVPISSNPTIKVPRSAVRICAGFYGVWIPKGTRIRMACHNPLCINPEHIGCSKTVKKRNVARGEQHGRAKLTESQVVQIRLRAEHEKQVDLAREFGVSVKWVNRIVNEKARKQERIRLNIW